MKFDKIVEQYLQESVRVKYNNGKIRYYKDLKHTILHRTEKDPETGLTLPAVIWADSIHKEWWKNGMCHRDEKDPETGLYLPAVVKNDNTKLWYKNDKLDRTDGPAIEWGDGKKEWIVNDRHISPKEIEQLKQKIELNKIIKSSEGNVIKDLFDELY